MLAGGLGRGTSLILIQYYVWEKRLDLILFIWILPLGVQALDIYIASPEMLFRKDS